MKKILLFLISCVGCVEAPDLDKEKICHQPVIQMPLLSTVGEQDGVVTMSAEEYRWLTVNRYTMERWINNCASELPLWKNISDAPY